MPDRGKVITGLELCTNISPDGCLMLCPYKDEKDETYSGFCEQVLKQDALALLNEQEAVEPIYIENPYTHLPVSYCPKCREPISKYITGNPYKETKYCHYCGQAVLWEGR